MNKRRILTFALVPVIALFGMCGITSGISASETEPVEIVLKRSEYEKHFDNGDGTTTAFISTVPLHYSDNGEWKEIDNTLTLDNSGNYINKSNSMKVKLSPETSVQTVNSNEQNQLVCVEKNGYVIS